jgi:DNA (cytosine-5)-methyltransferase 1
MKYLSICSGIEAASVAFEPLGWRPLAFSEIEAFPRAVLKHHYPDTPCHGDFTLLKDEPWIVDADMLCGGTPCQAFSVAGNRQSLADDRGNLTLQFVLLADAIDHLRSTAGREPAWILWENVPGVLSTNDNAFGAFLGGLVGRTAPIPEPADGWTGAGVVDGPTRCAAWRILDAQHFGLAQRRKRVFVLARGGAGRWAVADALLPIIQGSKWHSAPSRGEGEGVAGTLKACANSGGWSNSADHAAAGYMIPATAHTLRGEGFDASEDGTGRGIPLVMATGQASAMSAPTIDMAPTLSCNHEAPILMRMREGKEGGGKGPLVSEDQSLTLATANDQVLAAPFRETADCITSAYGTKWNGNASADNGSLFAKHGMQVRRLTPVECARLQGFQDDYLDITYRGKPAADGNKYKALGNSWAVPVVRWIGERIKAIRP